MKPSVKRHSAVGVTQEVPSASHPDSDLGGLRNESGEGGTGLITKTPETLVRSLDLSGGREKPLES